MGLVPVVRVPVVLEPVVLELVVLAMRDFAVLGLAELSLAELDAVRVGMQTLSHMGAGFGWRENNGESALRPAPHCFLFLLRTVKRRGECCVTNANQGKARQNRKSAGLSTIAGNGCAKRVGICGRRCCIAIAIASLHKEIDTCNVNNSRRAYTRGGKGPQKKQPSIQCVPSCSHPRFVSISPSEIKISETDQQALNLNIESHLERCEHCGSVWKFWRDAEGHRQRRLIGEYKGCNSLHGFCIHNAVDEF